MTRITFFDLEVDPSTSRIKDIGALLTNGSTFHKNNLCDFRNFIKEAEYFVGHNIFSHDLKYLEEQKFALPSARCIDTLFLSPLLFPKMPYHKLIKDDKLDPENFNNPLSDAIKAKGLFNDELVAFEK